MMMKKEKQKEGGGAYIEIARPEQGVKCKDGTEKKKNEN
jgi:hypothetical protein